MTKRIILIVVAIIVLVVIGVYYKKAKAEALPVSPSGSSNGSKSSGLPAGTFPLKRGQKNSLVKTLQSSLNKFVNEPLTLDGDYGPKTAAAAALVFSPHIKELNEVSKTQFENLIKGNPFTKTEEKTTNKNFEFDGDAAYKKYLDNMEHYKQQTG